MTRRRCLNCKALNLLQASVLPSIRLLILLLAVTSGRAFGSVTPAKESLYTAGREKTLQYISDHTTLASGVTRRGEALLVVSLGPTSFDFFGIALPPERSREFAATCEKGLSQAGFPSQDVSYSQERGVAVAAAYVEHGAFGSTHAHSQIDVKPLREAFADSGFHVRLVFRTRTYASVHGQGASVTSRGRWAYSDGSSLGLVTTSESLSGWQLLGLIYVSFGPGLIGGLGLWIGGNIAGNKSRDKEQRKATYLWVVKGSIFAAIGLHLPIFILFMAEGILQRACDLWFGTPSYMPIFGLGLFLGLFVMSQIAKKTAGLERDLFDRPALSGELLAQRRLARVRFFIISMGVTLLASAFGALGFRLWHELRVLTLSPFIGLSVGIILASTDEARRRAKPNNPT